MSMILRRELDRLRKMILSEGALVEDAIAKSISALTRRDFDLAQEVIKADEEIDRMEVEVEEECLKILALHHPVANDLRFVVAVLKMNNDLERMGDLATNIAKRAEFLATHDKIDLPTDFSKMAEKAKSMVKHCLDALVNADSKLARQVCLDDDELDEMRSQSQKKIQEAIKQLPQQAESLMKLLSVSRHLERLGDMATNISEDVIYMVEGEIIRHRGESPH